MQTRLERFIWSFLQLLGLSADRFRLLSDLASQVFLAAVGALR